MRISTRLKVIAVYSFVMIVIITASLFYVTIEIDRLTRENAAMLQLQMGVTELEILTSDYLLFQEPRAQKQWFKKHESLRASIPSASHENIDKQKLLKKIRNNIEIIGDVFGELSKLYEQPENENARTQTLISELKARLRSRMLLESREMSVNSFKLVNLTLDELRTLERREYYQVSILSFILFLGVTYITFTLRKSILVPIKILQEGMEVIGRGDLDFKFGSAKEDEIGDLSRSFDRMTSDLKQVTASRDDLKTEITVRKKAEAELIAKQMILDESQKLTHLGSWELELITNKLYWSDEVFRIFDMNPQDFGATYEAFLEAVHPEDRERVDSTYKKSQQDKSLYDIVHRIVRPDGSIRIVQNKGVHFFDVTGKVFRSLGSLHDITERILSEERLVKAKEEWERTFQAIGEIATVLDSNLRIIRVNKKACDVFSSKPEELEGKLCYELFHGGSTPCEGCPVAKSIDDFEVHTAEIRHEHLLKTFFVSASPILDAEGQVSGVVHFAKDITEQKGLEEKLLQAQKMEAIGTLAGGIAHDFNNILTPILGYADMAIDTLPPGSPALSEIQEVFKSANRAKELVKQILTFSRQAEQEMQPLKIQFVIKEALKLIRASIPTTIEIKQDIELECGAVLADPTQIHQIVMNLCTNAYQAMREKGGLLGVSLSQVELYPDDLIEKMDIKAGLYARLDVSDTGCGMDKIVLERIFDPYYTTKAKGEGTGLGLSVVHGIVKNLQGEISVYSEPGKGTTFHVYFPVIETEERAHLKPEVDERIPRGNEHVLVVDDEEIIVNMERMMLESLGYRVDIFTDSEEALKCFLKNHHFYDLIITDMTMPNMTGVEFSKAVLAVRPEMPIILCTGFSELISEDEAKSIGIKKYIMKPIISKDLGEIVRNVLDEQTSEA